MLENLRDYLENSYEDSPGLERLRNEIDENDSLMIRIRIGDYRHNILVIG